MPRNLCLRDPKGLAKGHVRATVVRFDYGLEVGLLDGKCNRDITTADLRAG